MPIYEYRCDDCAFQKEYLQKVSDPVLTRCPQCGKDTFKKMLTAAGFQLKGSGWYATDFKGSGSKPAAGSGEKKSDAVSGDAKPAAGSGESKPDSGGSKSDGGGTETKAVAAACGSGACPSCS